MDESNRIADFGNSAAAVPVVPPRFATSPVLNVPLPAAAVPSANAAYGRWLAFLACLLLVAAAPYLTGQIVYQIRFHELKAGVDVANETLAGLNPRLDDFETASRMIARRLEPSVVSIFRPGIGGREGQGSGVIVDREGYIVTNHHVVKGAPEIQVQLSDGRTTITNDIRTDEVTDLAVLKIDLPNLIAAEWGDSDKLEVGDLVWAMGSPFGLDRSITFGIVSAKARRSGSRLTTNLYQEYLQTDAAVNPGNSGGPLINIRGQVVGINAAIFGQSYQGISFAIPSKVASQEYAQLRVKGWVERAWLGIRPLAVPQGIQEQFGLAIGEGVYVGHVQPDAPADRAGIHRGDVILQWNGFAATDPTLLSRAIAATEVGSTAKVRLVRAESSNGEESTSSVLELAVPVERHPDSAPRHRGR